MYLRNAIFGLACLAYTVFANPIENITAEFAGGDVAPKDISLNVTHSTNSSQNTLTEVKIRYLTSPFAPLPIVYHMGMIDALSKLAVKENTEWIDQVFFARSVKPWMTFQYRDSSHLTNVALLIEIISLLNERLKADYQWSPFVFTAFFNGEIVGNGAMRIPLPQDQSKHDNQTSDFVSIQSNNSESTTASSTLNLTEAGGNSSVETTDMSLFDRKPLTREVVFDPSQGAARFGPFMVLDELIDIAAKLTLLPKESKLVTSSIYSCRRLQLRQEIEPGVKDFYNYYTLLSIWALAQKMYDTKLWIAAYVQESLGYVSIGKLFIEYAPRQSAANNLTIEANPSATS